MRTKIKVVLPYWHSKVDSVDITTPVDNKNGRQCAEEMADDLVRELWAYFND